MDKPSVVTNILPRKVTAVAVQIVPVAYHVHPTLRVELYHIPFPAGLYISVLLERVTNEATFEFTMLFIIISVGSRSPDKVNVIKSLLV